MHYNLNAEKEGYFLSINSLAPNRKPGNDLTSACAMIYNSPPVPRDEITKAEYFLPNGLSEQATLH